MKKYSIIYRTVLGVEILQKLTAFNWYDASSVALSKFKIEYPHEYKNIESFTVREIK